MTEGSPRRAWPLLDATLFCAALVLYAIALPLGLAAVEVAPQVAASITLDAGAESATLVMITVRLMQLFPLGDLPLRSNLASALFGAAAIALVGRICVEIMVSMRPAANARQDARSFWHEPIAAAGAAIAVALALSPFAAATSGRATVAASLLLLVAALRAGLVLLQDSGAAKAGLSLTGLAGVSVGVDPVAGPLLWPLLVGIAIWALRSGARWPLLAPLGFIAAWGGSALAAVACSATPMALTTVVAELGKLSVHGGTVLWATSVELGDELGVIAALLSAIGLVVVAMRMPLVAAWLGMTLLSALLFAPPLWLPGAATGPAAAALPLALTTVAVLASAGLVHVGGRLGRARKAATLALAIMLLLTPALDGGMGRRPPRSSLSMHLLDHALDRVALRAAVDAGTREMDGIFRLARALGMRPDLVLTSLPHRPPSSSPR